MRDGVCVVMDRKPGKFRLRILFVGIPERTHTTLSHGSPRHHILDVRVHGRRPCGDRQHDPPDVAVDTLATPR
jgi:hypothetical protein